MRGRNKEKRRKGKRKRRYGKGRRRERKQKKKEGGKEGGVACGKRGRGKGTFMEPEEHSWALRAFP